jgi:hypothetical protein
LQVQRESWIAALPLAPGNAAKEREVQDHHDARKTSAFSVLYSVRGKSGWSRGLPSGEAAAHQPVTEKRKSRPARTRACP